MPRVPTEQEREVLERLIDATSLSDVLMAVAVTCTDKETHLNVNWQDGLSAKRWGKARDAIEKLAASPAVGAVS